MTVLALAGGVGGAKLAFGLARNLPPDKLIIAVNTGDDFTHLGLRICPDLDTVMYTLAGIANPDSGWGIKDESWNVIAALERLGGPAWFRLGDKDIATHLERTRLLADGKPLSEVTGHLCRRLGIKHRIVPATDDRVSTIVQTEDGPLPFQDYFVRLQCNPVVRGFEFSGANRAAPSPVLSDAFENGSIEAVILCPSNPFVSIAPILAVPHIRETIAADNLPVWVVSPIVGGSAIKGPTAKMMRELAIEPSCFSIAEHYRNLATGIVIDTVDADTATQIDTTGLQVMVTDTVMTTDDDKVRLAREVLDGAGLSHV
ncbi:MAG: 2-phospho-L-lactate transferase [Rhodospirillaceae bacterium]|nr:2-phospho-L-lactate transferase [Rhodospirillaceae bacterium]